MAPEGLERRGDVNDTERRVRAEPRRSLGPSATRLGIDQQGEPRRSRIGQSNVRQPRAEPMRALLPTSRLASRLAGANNPAGRNRRRAAAQARRQVVQQIVRRDWYALARPRPLGRRLGSARPLAAATAWPGQQHMVWQSGAFCRAWHLWKKCPLS